MHPIIPMEPISCETIPEGPNWIAQVKWDGVRIVTYFDGQETRLFNRRKMSGQSNFRSLLTYKHTAKLAP